VSEPRAEPLRAALAEVEAILDTMVIGQTTTGAVRARNIVRRLLSSEQERRYLVTLRGTPADMDEAYGSMTRAVTLTDAGYTFMRLDASPPAEPRAEGLREAQADWPSHYTPDMAKAWIAAFDRVEAVLLASQLTPAPLDGER
jgi:hypothetical protein